MRTRTFVFALVCGTATAALAQDGGYVRFSATSPDACAMACASDQMCASWSYGSTARSYGQSQSGANNGGASGGMCTFSGSSVVRNGPGFVSGLPRREAMSAPIPMTSAPNQQGFPRSAARQSSPNNGGSGWDVRPAPWLNNGGGAMQSQPAQAPRGMPQRIAPVPDMPSVTPSPSPRIEYESRAAPSIRPLPAQPSTPAYVAPVYVAPAYVAPASVAPPVQSAPMTIAPPRQPARAQQPMEAPAPPPGTRDMSDGPILEAPSIPFSAAPSIVPPRPRAARGLPKNRATRPISAAPTTAPIASAIPDDGDARIALPPRSTPASALPSVGATIAPARRPAPARGTPRPTAVTTPQSPPFTSASGGAPPRQETAARPAPGRGTPRTPVRDPSNPESFRGADGMIDAAEMRRAQLNAAREQGTPAYSVQREWEAVAAEGARAEAAGEVRVDPLAGTSPIPPPPETRAERRAREAEEAAETAAEARANANSDTTEEEAAPPPRRPAPRGARGVPRPKAPARTSQNGGAQQVADATPVRRAPQPRRAPAQALDREPRLSGGPG